MEMQDFVGKLRKAKEIRVYQGTSIEDDASTFFFLLPFLSISLQDVNR